MTTGVVKTVRVVAEPRTDSPCDGANFLETLTGRAVSRGERAERVGPAL
jgi:hypothetical protein